MIELVLVHIGGDTKAVPVYGHDGYALRIRWGMAGIYKLNLKSNFLYGARQLRALDIEQARKIWRELRYPHPSVADCPLPYRLTKLASSG